MQNKNPPGHPIRLCWNNLIKDHLSPSLQFFKGLFSSRVAEFSMEFFQSLQNIFQELQLPLEQIKQLHEEICKILLQISSTDKQTKLILHQFTIFCSAPIDPSQNKISRKYKKYKALVVEYLQVFSKKKVVNSLAEFGKHPRKKQKREVTKKEEEFEDFKEEFIKKKDLSVS